LRYSRFENLTDRPTPSLYLLNINNINGKNGILIGVKIKTYSVDRHAARKWQALYKADPTPPKAKAARCQIFRNLTALTDASTALHALRAAAVPGRVFDPLVIPRAASARLFEARQAASLLLEKRKDGPRKSLAQGGAFTYEMLSVSG